MVGDTYSDLISGRIYPREVAERIAARIKRANDDATVRWSAPLTPPNPLKRKRELKTTVKVGVRAPIPFPSVVVHCGRRLCISSHLDGVAVFDDSESVQVIITTHKQNGSVGGVPCEVDMVTDIRADSDALARVEGRVEEAEHSPPL